MTRTVAAALFALVVLAGCSGAEDGVGATADLEGTAGTLAARPPPGEAWVLSGCQVMRFSLVQERQAAAQGLPPDHRPRGDVASLVLTAMACDALTRGNHSVAAPFAWSFVITPLEALDDDGSLEAYVREFVASDPAVTRALSAFGFPAVEGAVAMAASGGGLSAAVSAADLRYSVDVPASAPRDTGPSDQQRLRGAAATRLFWMDCTQQVAESSVVDTPALAMLEGGAMARQLGNGGAMPGQAASSSEDWSCALGEHDSA